MSSRIVFLIIILSVLICQSAAVSQEKNNTDWSDPDSINIYDASLGDFLDFDISEYQKKAQQFYNDGEYENAAKYYLALARFNSQDGGSVYNLACCYGLLGEADLAAKYLKRAYNAGFTAVDHMQRDPDFEKVRDSDVFKKVIEELIQKSEEESDKSITIMVPSEAFFECKVVFPEDYKNDQKRDLVLGLHGYGASPENFIRVYDRFDNPDFIYASAEAPYPFMVGSRIGYSWSAWDPNDEGIGEKANYLTEEYVVAVVNEMKEKYNIGKVYLLGFSQGCATAYKVGIKYHEMFDGIICFGGWLDVDWLGEDVIGEAKNLKVFIAHGTEDRMVEFKAGIDSEEYLEERGYDVKFFMFNGPHTVPENALHAVQRWMSSN